MASNSNMQEIIHKIEDAFSDITLENGVSLREARVIDDYGDDMQRQAARAEDELENWQDISYSDIEKYPDIFCFLDAKGVLFHLPAYMIYLICKHENAHSVVKDSIIYGLSPNTYTPDLQTWFVERFSLINAQQATGILTFLDWTIANTEDEFDIEDIEEAAKYWRKRLNS